MQFSYFPKLEAQPEGGFTVTFRDVPEAITQGETEAEALEMAREALLLGLDTYVEAGEPIPVPSARKRGDFKAPVSVPAVAAAKLALYEAMRERGLSKLAFARLLGVSETAARRLLQLDHRSHMDTIESALAKLDRRVTVQIEPTIRAA